MKCRFEVEDADSGHIVRVLRMGPDGSVDMTSSCLPADKRDLLEAEIRWIARSWEANGEIGHPRVLVVSSGYGRAVFSLCGVDDFAHEDGVLSEVLWELMVVMGARAVERESASN